MEAKRIEKAPIEDLVKQLVAENSVSTQSNLAVTQKVASWLEAIGFQTEWIPYNDAAGIAKASIVAKRDAKKPRQEKGLLLGGASYLAHTDVVPVEDWHTGFSGPFEAVEKEGRLYGRGTCDMKGSLCCAIQAAAKIDPSDQTKPIYFVVTADEEIGMQGAQQVHERSQLWKEMIDLDVAGIIGEPTEMVAVTVVDPSLVEHKQDKTPVLIKLERPSNLDGSVRSAKVVKKYPNQRYVETDTLGRVFVGEKGNQIKLQQLINVKDGVLYLHNRT